MMKWSIVFMLVLLIPSVTFAGVPPHPPPPPPPPLWTYVHAETSIVDTGIQVRGDTVTTWMTVQADNYASAWSKHGYAGFDMMFDATIYTGEDQTQARSEVRMFDVDSPAYVKGHQDGTLTIATTYARIGFEGWVRFSSDAYAEARAGYYGSKLFKQCSQDWDFKTLTRYWSWAAARKRTSQPVSEHVVWYLPADAWWVDLQRVELDGSLTDVPPLYPANQLPSPVHGDLMVHSSQPCDYVMRVCYQDGRCDAPKMFTVNYTGSQGLSEVRLDR